MVGAAPLHGYGSSDATSGRLRVLLGTIAIPVSAFFPASQWPHPETKHFIKNQQKKDNNSEQANGNLISTQNIHEKIKWVDSDLISKHKTDYVYANTLST